MRQFFTLLIFLSVLSNSALGSNNPVEIRLWHQMIYSHREVLSRVLGDFEREHPQIRVRQVYRETEELRSAFQSSAMGGGGPELIFGPSDQVGPFKTMGLIRELNSYFSEGELSDFDANSIIRLDGQILMLGSSVGNNLMLIYNRRLLPEAPQNLEDFILAAKANTLDLNGDGLVDRWGLVFNFTEPFFFVPWIGAFGGHFVDENSLPILDSPATEQAFRFVRDLRTVHKVIPSECDYEMANALFKEGRAAMIINGDWSLGDYAAAGIDYGIAPLPQNSQNGLWPTPLVGTTGYSINANLKDPKVLQATLLVLKFLLSEKVQALFAKETGILPSRKSVRQQIAAINPRASEMSVILSKGRPMPIHPEIRAVWDALRGPYQSVLAGAQEPAVAAKSAQNEALRQIAVMNEVRPRDPSFWPLALAGLALVVVGGWALLSGTVAFFKGLLGHNRLAYLFSAPGILAVFLVVIFPFGYNLVISVSNFSLKTYSDWHVIGLSNYLDVLTDNRFYTLLAKTLLWTLVNVTFHVCLGVLLALAVNTTLPAKGLIRALLIIPWAIPQYITALTWRSLFHQEYGPINQILAKLFHLSPVQWLSDPWMAFSACILTNIWLGFPFMMIVTLGGLQSIPNDLYDSAKIDGAGPLARFQHITLPLLVPVLAPASVLGAIWTFNNLNVIWLVSNGGEPADSTHILVSYVYKSAFNLYRYGYASALSTVIFFLLAVFTWFFVIRKGRRAI
ncbi:MAG: extracellular solute-binding protein [Bdellovibrionaceae bacterium]|nr:extracellular solute-binding protein [Pseudobdellovibrionaceae bacterium]